MRRVAAAFMVFVLAGISEADVFHMGDGLTSLEFVTVGNPGNAPDTRYMTPGHGAVSDVYRISRYEVTAGQYTAFLNAVAATDTYGLYNTVMWSDTFGCKIQRSGSSGSYTYSVAADRANRPVNYVSFWDVARFINWLHNGQGNGDTENGAYTNIGNQSTFARQAGGKYWIPTENEWYKAAYHKNDGVTGNYFDYPTGSDIVPSNDLIDPDPGNNANYYVFGGDYTTGNPYYTTEVGAFQNSASPYGTFDQGGNLYEWNETAVTTWTRGLRAGGWTSDSFHLLASYSTIQYPMYKDYTVGFRVASVPVPYVVSVDVNAGGVSRSMVTSLVVAFSQLVTIDAGAFEVIQRGVGTAVDVSFTTEDVNDQTMATLTFNGDLTDYGSLVDGNYQLTVRGDLVWDRVSGLALDGDEDGAAGGDYVFGDALVDNFFRLFGDLDGSRFVGNDDYAAFRFAFRKALGEDGYEPQFDSDDSEFIGNNDYALFRVNFRTGLPFE